MTMNPLALLRAVLATLTATAATAATLRNFREEPAPNADAPGPAADSRDVGGLRNFPEEPAPNATGGDAMLIDHAKVDFWPPSHTQESKIWGTVHNRYGWCVSTKSNDFDGHQYLPSSACRCRYQFHWDNTTSAYWFPCSGTEEGRLAVEPGR